MTNYDDSTFTNDVFSFIYSYLSIVELNESHGDSATQTSRYTIVRQEIHIISKLLSANREDLTKNEITQHVKHDLQKVLARFIIDCFSHNLGFIEQTRKNFRPQKTDDETVLAEKSDCVRDPEWSHESFIIIPTVISSQAFNTISNHKIMLEYIHLQLTPHLQTITHFSLKEQEIIV